MRANQMDTLVRRLATRLDELAKENARLAEKVVTLEATYASAGTSSTPDEHSLQRDGWQGKQSRHMLLRSVLGGAAALGAGALLDTQTRTVSAAGSDVTRGQTTFVSTTSSPTVTVINNGTGAGISATNGGTATNAILGTSVNYTAVAGKTSSTSTTTAGVYGSGGFVGVAGFVAGASTAPGTPVGVYGSGSNGSHLGGTGVEGVSDTGVGITASSNSGPGLVASSNSGNGITASSTSAGGIVATSGGGSNGVYGSSVNGNGVYGISTNGTGVWGEAPANVAVVGLSHANLAIGVSGVCDGPNGNGVSGTCNNGSNAYGVVGRSTTGYGVFCGGNFAATGTKSAIVPFPDGSHRQLYCLESPDCWFEDFGAASLVNGHAVVVLDPAFAAVVDTDDYFVFLTAEGESQGLYVSSKERDQFTVQEQQGGSSTLTVSYRVVARRKDVEAPRFKTVTLKEPLILPTVPATP